MTNERREEVILLALVISVVLHAGLMLFVKPEVMVRVVSSGRRVTRHEPMRVADSNPAEKPQRASLSGS